MASVSQIRQNFTQEVELAVNQQINMELNASYVYQSMAFHFDRDDVALHGFSKYFSENSEEEREHAEKLMKYINKRGGKVLLCDVKKPLKDEWGTGLQALETALDLEKKVNQSLLDLQRLASHNGDAHLADFIEEEYLGEQVDHIYELGQLITRLKRAGPGLGEYIFDKDLKSSSAK